MIKYYENCGSGNDKYKFDTEYSLESKFDTNEYSAQPYDICQGLMWPGQGQAWGYGYGYGQVN